MKFNDKDNLELKSLNTKNKTPPRIKLSGVVVGN
ncbi:hypothetical protein SAN_1387 [Streptococcus agalactiae COH1]|nr:hypothetical protein SAN_1387 [Streptococcus agalactiae COH1]